MGQRLRGLVGQGMGAPKGFGPVKPRAAGMPVVATSGSGSFTATRPCTVLIYLWGGGASGQSNTGLSGGNGGGSAGALRKYVHLARGETISWVIGAGGAAVPADGNGLDGVDSTVTLPNGNVLRAGKGIGSGAGGVSSGGDLNRNGNAGQTIAQGMAGGPPAGFPEDAADLVSSGGGAGHPSLSIAGQPGRLVLIPLRAS